MISHFKSKSYFSGVLGYPRLTVVGELSSDAAILTRFLLVTFLCLPFAIWLSLALVVAWTSCEPVRLIPHYWMSRFPLVQIVDVLPSSWVPLEPWCALPQAMLYSGCLCVAGVACLVHLGAKMVDLTFLFKTDENRFLVLMIHATSNTNFSSIYQPSSNLCEGFLLHVDKFRTLRKPHVF